MMNNLRVNESSKNIRSLALQALKGNWWKAVGAGVVSTLLVMGPALIIQELLVGRTSFEIFLIIFGDSHFKINIL